MKEDLLLNKLLKKLQKKWKMMEGNGKIKKQIRNKTSINFGEK